MNVKLTQPYDGLELDKVYHVYLENQNGWRLTGVDGYFPKDIFEIVLSKEELFYQEFGMEMGDYIALYENLPDEWL